MFKPCIVRGLIRKGKRAGMMSTVKPASVCLGRSRTVQNAILKQRVKLSLPTSLTRAMKKLKPQDKQYVFKRLNGESQKSAYNSSYQDKGTTIPEHKPEVQAALNQADKAIRGSLLSALELRQFVLDELVSVGRYDLGGTKVKALELLGKTRNVNLFVSEVEHSHTYDVADVRARIMELIQLAQSRQPPDVSDAEIIQPQAADSGDLNMARPTVAVGTREQ